jgi:hypothetical protein
VAFRWRSFEHQCLLGLTPDPFQNLHPLASQIVVEPPLFSCDGLGRVARSGLPSASGPPASSLNISWARGPSTLRTATPGRKSSKSQIREHLLIDPDGDSRPVGYGAEKVVAILNCHGRSDGVAGIGGGRLGEVGVCHPVSEVGAFEQRDRAKCRAPAYDDEFGWRGDRLYPERGRNRSGAIWVVSHDSVISDFAGGWLLPS